MGNHLLQWKYIMVMFSMKIAMCNLHNVLNVHTNLLFILRYDNSSKGFDFLRNVKDWKNVQNDQFCFIVSWTQVHVPSQITFCVKNKIKPQHSSQAQSKGNPQEFTWFSSFMFKFPFFKNQNFMPSTRCESMPYTSHKSLETNIITQGDVQEILLDKIWVTSLPVRIISQFKIPSITFTIVNWFKYLGFVHTY